MHANPISHRVYLFIYLYIYASTAVLMRGIRTFGPGKESATETDWLTSAFALIFKLKAVE